MKAPHGPGGLALALRAAGAAAAAPDSPEMLALRLQQEMMNKKIFTPTPPRLMGIPKASSIAFATQELEAKMHQGPAEVSAGGVALVLQHNL
eukprot:s3260_g3.t1